MKTLAVIPARFGSVRFPGKPLVNIGGKSMVVRVYEQVMKAARVDSVLVATDDERILNEVVINGGKAVMTGAHHQSGTDRCSEVLDLLDEEYDLLINVQGDEPFIQAQQIDELLEVFDDQEVEIATQMKRLENVADLLNPNRVKVVFDINKNALYFSRQAIPYEAGSGSHRLAGGKSSFYLHVGMYAFRASALKFISRLNPTALEGLERLEQLRWLEHGCTIRMQETRFDSPSIDVPEDLDKIAHLF